MITHARFTHYGRLWNDKIDTSLDIDMIETEV